MRERDPYLLRVFGEVDVSTAAELRLAVFEALETAPRIEIDLGGTSFFDSSGLTVLVGASRLRGFDRNAIRVSNASRSIRKVLSITGLDHIVAVAD
ncbi:MAG TPA: STAS domain-containing protein [Acidimicrobiales bacterium]|nr:STAS domain-containing protein [Acidimicrobiales bacterium]